MVSCLKNMSLSHRLLLYTFMVCVIGTLSLYFIIIPRYAVLQKKQVLTDLRDQRTEEIKDFLRTNEQAIQLVFGQTDVLSLIDTIVEQAGAQSTQEALQVSEQFSALLQSYK